VLFTVVVAIWIGPAARSVFRAAEQVSFLENRYTILTRAAHAYDGNVQELEALYQKNRLLSYYDLMSTVDRITDMANTHNLRKRNFAIGEPTGFDTHAFEQLVELNIRMESTGTVYDSLGFLMQLQNMPVTIPDIVLDIRAYVDMNVEIAILSGG